MSRISKIEDLIREGKSNSFIKNSVNCSTELIEKIRDGKITSDRVIIPKCDNREEELCFLYKNTKKEYNDLVKITREFEARIDNLEYILKEKNKQIEMLQDICLEHKEMIKLDRHYLDNKNKTIAYLENIISGKVHGHAK